MFVVRRHIHNLARCVLQFSILTSLPFLAIGQPRTAQASLAQRAVPNDVAVGAPAFAPPAQDPQPAPPVEPAPPPPPEPLPLVEPTAVPPTPVPFVPRAVKPLELPPGTINIALLGVDTRPQFEYQNTDVIVIASINPEIPSVTMLSIPRDTYSYMPRRYLGKINQAFGIGGFELFTKTLMHNFGIKVDHYAMVNFQALVHSVDSFGGVDIIATCPLYHMFPRDPFYMGGLVVTQKYTDQFTGEVYKPGTLVPTQTIDLPKPGIYTLNGLQALAYVRARKGIPGGDVDRGRREIRMIRALFAKAKQIGTLAKIPELLADFQSDVTTDLTLPDLLGLAGLADRFDDTVIRSRFLDPGGANGQALSDEALVGANRSDWFWRQRRDYLQTILTVSVNQKAGDYIPVEVINGTSDAGFAVAAADRLNELGFRVMNIRAASEIQPKTQILDHTTNKKGSAVSLLTRTFNLQANQVVDEPRPDGVRYTITIGPDFNTCYYAPSLEASGSTQIATGEAPANPQDALPPTINVVAPLPSPTPSAVAAPVALTGTRATSATLAITQPTTQPTAQPTSRPTAQPTGQPTPTPASAVQAFVLVAGTTAINVRQTPSLSGTIIGSLAIGAQAPIVGRSPDNQWFQIRTTPNGIGWVYQSVVQVQGDVSRLPVLNT